MTYEPQMNEDTAVQVVALYGVIVWHYRQSIEPTIWHNDSIAHYKTARDKTAQSNQHNDATSWGKIVHVKTAQ